MIQELKERVYRDYIDGYSEYEIADRNNLKRGTVHKTIQSIKGTLEHRLSNVAIFEFEQYFMKFKDAIEVDMGELSKLIDKEQNIDRKLRLMDARQARRKDLYMLLGDGEMVLVLKKMKKDGITQNTAQTA